MADAEDAGEIAQREVARLLDQGEHDGGFENWDYDQFRAEVNRQHAR